MKTFADLLAGIACTVLAASLAHAQEKVTFNMSWLPQGSAVGTAVARDKGWFKEAGLDVNMMRGYGGNRTANELDQSQFDVGYVDPLSVMLNRLNGGKIKMIGAINTEWPGGICYQSKQREVKSLDDLGGLRMGGGSASPVQNIVPAWLELNGKPRDFIRMLRLDPAVVDSSLIEGKVDLAECWRASNRAVLRKQATAAGVSLAWIEYSAYGLDSYGSGFAAREEMIAKKPEVLSNFLRMSYRGYEFARANPDQAADIMVKQFPAADRGVVLEQIQDINQLIVDKSVADKGLGYMREDRMRKSFAFINNAFDLKDKVPVEDIYTNALLGN
jgi:NitT/TauT family transport system substrate-binding protein